jgi:hypothetical protein
LILASKISYFKGKNLKLWDCNQIIDQNLINKPLKEELLLRLNNRRKILILILPSFEVFLKMLIKLLELMKLLIKIPTINKTLIKVIYH